MEHFTYLYSLTLRSKTLFKYSRKITKTKENHLINMEYFDDLLKKPSLFLDEGTLDVNYIPEKLPYREKEIFLLSQLFLSLITNPFSISRKILVQGKKNLGITATLKIFSNMLKEAAHKRQVNIDYVYINCKIEQTPHRVLVKIIRKMKPNFPEKGYSNAEILDQIGIFLEKKKLYLVIILDDLDQLKSNTHDIIYLLSHIQDDKINNPQHLSLIGVIEDFVYLTNISTESKKMLEHNIIKFNNYSQEQMFDILKYRVELGIRKFVISDEILSMIAGIAYKRADVREGIHVLWKATKIAESKQLKYVTSECVRLAAEES